MKTQDTTNSNGLVHDTALMRKVFFKQLRSAFGSQGSFSFSGYPESRSDAFNSFVNDLSKRPLTPLLEDKIIENLLSCYNSIRYMPNCSEGGKIAAFLQEFYHPSAIEPPLTPFDVSDRLPLILKESIEHAKKEEEEAVVKIQSAYREGFFTKGGISVENVRVEEEKEEEKEEVKIDDDSDSCTIS